MSGLIDQVVHGHLYFYQLLGLHGLPLPEDVHPKRTVMLLRIWAVSLMCGFSVIFVICETSDDDYLYMGDYIGWFNDGLKFVFSEMAILSIYCETLWHRCHLSRFWQLYAALAATQTPVGTLRLQLKQHRRYLLSLYGTILLELFSLFVLGFLLEITHHLLLFWVTFQPFVLVVHLRNTQFVLYLDLLRQQMVQLERELSLLVAYSSFASAAASFVGFENYLRRRLRQKQVIYARIYELSTCFTQAFSYSLLTVPLMIYMRIAVDCYFMYYVIYHKINNIDYYLLLPALFEVPVLIYASQSCMQMVPRIAYQLHNIVSITSELSLQIQNFSLQILHQPVCIDCLGITKLDSYLLTRITCAVCTYIIFTVQLMPKLSNSYV